MARVGHYCAVMHCGEMGAVNHMTVSGDCDEYIADWGGLFYRHNSETIHDCLNGPNWIYFADDDISAHPAGPHCDALSTPAIPDDNQCPSGQKDISSSNDSVECRLAGSISIV